MPPTRRSTAASAHIQRVILSGSVKNSNTVSRLAWTWISLTIGSVSVCVLIASPLFAFCLVAQCRQPVVPEVVQEPAQVGEARGSRPVQPACAVAALLHQPRLAERA